MAHATKLHADAVAPMLHHYRRDREGVLSRDNIDRDLVRLNYVIPCTHGREVEQMIARALATHDANGRKHRKDAVVLVDWVVTVPRGLRPEDERRYFETVHDFACARYGADNVACGYVHKDEPGAQPHMHLPVVPLVQGRLNAKAMVSRKDLQTWHQDLQKCVDDVLGYHTEVTLDERHAGERDLSRLNNKEYARAKAALSTQAQELARAEQATLDAQARQAVTEVEQVRASTQLDATKAELSTALDVHDDLNAKIEQMRGELASLSTQLASAKEQLKAAQDKRDEAIKQANEQVKAAQESAEKAARLDTQVRAKTERVRTLERKESELETVAEERDAAVAERDQARAERDALSTQVNDLKADLADTEKGYSNMLSEMADNLKDVCTALKFAVEAWCGYDGALKRLDELSHNEYIGPICGTWAAWVRDHAHTIAVSRHAWGQAQKEALDSVKSAVDWAYTHALDKMKELRDDRQWLADGHHISDPREDVPTRKR